MVAAIYDEPMEKMRTRSNGKEICGYSLGSAISEGGRLDCPVKPCVLLFFFLKTTKKMATKATNTPATVIPTNVTVS